MRVDRAALRILDLERAIVKMTFHAPLQLPDGENRLHQASCANGVSAGDQPARRIDGAGRFLGQVQAIVDIRKKSFA